MKLTAKQILIIIAIVVVILITVGVWFYLKGKKTVTIQKPPLDDPNADQGTGNNPNAVSNGQITAIASALFEDMKGFNWSGHNSEPYKNLDSLSDTDFVNVYNTFNAAHQSDSKETLKQWIENEDYAFSDITKSILERMGRLNLI